MGTRPSTPRQSGVRFSNQPPGETIEYEKLEGYLDNFSHAATNEKAWLKQLTDVVALLTSTNARLVAKNNLSHLTKNLYATNLAVYHVLRLLPSLEREKADA